MRGLSIKQGLQSRCLSCIVQITQLPAEVVLCSAPWALVRPPQQHRCCHTPCVPAAYTVRGNGLRSSARKCNSPAAIKHISCHNIKQSNKIQWGSQRLHSKTARCRVPSCHADGQKWRYAGAHTATQPATLQCSQELTLTCSAYKGAECPAAAAAYCISWVICCIASGGRSGA